MKLESIKLAKFESVKIANTGVIKGGNIDETRAGNGGSTCDSEAGHEVFGQGTPQETTYYYSADRTAYDNNGNQTTKDYNGV